MTTFHLRIIALVTMLIDHIYVAFFPLHLWMNCIGRLSFPIFAFQLAEGYRKTGHYQNYALRLFLFALVSEIPFDLMAYKSLFFWSHQNILWTLLLGLLTLRLIDQVMMTQQIDTLIRFLAIFLIIFTSMLVAYTFNTDYSAFGVLMISMFFLLRQKPWWLQTLCVLLLNFLIGGTSLSIFGAHIPIQVFGTLAMIPIYFYCGNQGHHSRIWCRVCYLFYPIHLLILYLFSR